MDLSFLHADSENLAHSHFVGFVIRRLKFTIKLGTHQSVKCRLNGTSSLVFVSHFNCHLTRLFFVFFFFFVLFCFFVFLLLLFFQKKLSHKSCRWKQNQQIVYYFDRLKHPGNE